jgi:protein SCO1/2
MNAHHMFLSLLCVAAAAMPAATLFADEMTDSGMHAHQMHAQHESAGPLTLSTVDYDTPDVQLVRDDGTTVSLRSALDDGRPVIMNFIFTTCTSICPLLSQTFAAFAQRLSPDRAKVHLVSISVDPEQDTPERLREYAQRFHAGPEWQHYTGTLAETPVFQLVPPGERDAQMVSREGHRRTRRGKQRTRDTVIAQSRLFGRG